MANTEAGGQTIIYSDTYMTDRLPTTYGYARHDVEQQTFLSLLDEFITTAVLVEFPELRNSSARCVIQTRNDHKKEEFPSYGEAIASLKSLSLLFVRIYFLFGDMTVEFQESPLIVKNELDLADRGMLRRAIASPLVAFDFSKSDIWSSFLTSVHWARSLLPVDVLRKIARMAARVVT